MSYIHLNYNDKAVINYISNLFKYLFKIYPKYYTITITNNFK